MQFIKKLSPSAVIASVALFASLGGGAYAATGLIHTKDLANRVVVNKKIRNGAVGWAKLNQQVQSKIDSGVKAASAVGVTVNAPQGATGPAGSAGANGQNGTDGTNGSNGSDGATGPQGVAGVNAGPAPGSSTQTATPDLTLDAAPGPQGADGSSGWGWDNTANGPVTTLAAGSTNTFTVTVLQSNPQADGTITLSYSPTDFTFDGNGDSSATESTLGNSVTFAYSDLAHGAKSDSFTFTANSASSVGNPYAVINVTVVVGGETVTQVVPIQING